jgi:hypothetical protein
MGMGMGKGTPRPPSSLGLGRHEGLGLSAWGLATTQQAPGGHGAGSRQQVPGPKCQASGEFRQAMAAPVMPVVTCCDLWLMTCCSERFRFRFRFRSPLPLPSACMDFVAIRGSWVAVGSGWEPGQTANCKPSRPRARARARRGAGSKSE